MPYIDVFDNVFNQTVIQGVYSEFIDGYIFETIDPETLYQTRTMAVFNGLSPKLCVIQLDHADYRGRAVYSEFRYTDSTPSNGNYEPLCNAQAALEITKGNEDRTTDKHIMRIFDCIQALLDSTESKEITLGLRSSELFDDTVIVKLQSLNCIMVYSSSYKLIQLYTKNTDGQVCFNGDMSIARFTRLWGALREYVLHKYFIDVYRHFYFSPTQTCKCLGVCNLIVDGTALRLRDGIYCPENCNELEQFMKLYKRVVA